MWDDLEIGGKGNEFGCSAVKIFGIEFEHISENSISYWVSNCIGGLGLRVMKDTKEGQRIKKMVDEKYTQREMLDYFNRLLFRKLPPTRLLIAIENMKQEEYERGRRDKLREVQRALGFPDGFAFI